MGGKVLVVFLCRQGLMELLLGIEAPVYDVQQC